jgi:nickel/cobalt transporter (NicO) family protein
VLDGGTIPKSAPATLHYRDTNWSGRIGWVEVVLQADHGAAVRASSVGSHTKSDQLRAYPKNLLQSPLHVSSADSRIVAGAAAGVAPALTSERSLRSPVRVASHSDTGFAALVAKTRLSPGIILVAVLLAIFWGAAHALTPGHGKTIVAAYLVGSRGNARHALLLGLIVTFTHTLGVFALGLVTLALSEFVVPEQLYPWLNLVSALLVVGVGLAVLRTRVTGWRRPGPAHHHHHHDHADHHHDHDHLPASGSGLKGLVAVGISGGLLPCPTALVVLLAAISLHRIGYGLLLIVAFSAGLAGMISAIGLLAVGAKRTFRRVSFEGRVVRALPAVSAVVVLALGLAMTVRAVPKLT